MTGSGNAQRRGGPNGSWRDNPLSRRTLLIGAGSVGAVAALAGCTGGSSPSGSPTGPPKTGGNFRLGVTGGGSKDIFDAHNVLTAPDTARVFTAFETLLVFDDNYRLATEGLAESVEADNPTQYTVRLRKGIEFQNGKTLTADDVIYSWQRVGTESLGLSGYTSTLTYDLGNVKKLDKYTLRLPLKVADSTVPEKMAHYSQNIVPVGYEGFKGDPSTQIGTGAFKLKSFTPGQESVSERYANYWRDAYFDTVTITDFSDVTAQINALQGGQIDAMTDLPAAQIDAVKANGLKVVVSPSGAWNPLCMAVDMPPFDDERVRQAFRLIVDRQAMLDQVASGHGDIGNDLYGRFDVAYLSDAPQRERDIEQAKSLLKAAGHENLTVDLYTTNAAAGMVATATVFAEQAKDAGVTVNVKNLPGSTFYGDDYLKYAFSIDWWTSQSYLALTRLGQLSTSPYNNTHWPPKTEEGAKFEDLYNQALATIDDAKRIEIEHQMQQIQYDSGGYIIPFFPDRIEACAANVQGLKPSKLPFNLGNYGHGYRTIWFG